MNRAVTIAFKAGAPFVVTGPEVPIEKQSADFKTLIQTGVEGCESLELWTSANGCEKRKKLPQVVPLAVINKPHKGKTSNNQ